MIVMTHKPTGPTDINLMNFIVELRKTKKASNKLIAKHLSKPRRSKMGVTLDKISRTSRQNEVIIVPGKVLSTGDLDKKLTIYAWKFSKGAEEKIKKSGSSCKSLQEILKEKNNGRIII